VTAALYTVIKFQVL